MNGGLAWWLQAAAAGCWLAAILAAVRPRARPDGAGAAARILAGLGLAICLATLAGLWWQLGRPPLRTLGETRLWYATLSVVSGALVAWRVRSDALRIPMLAIGSLFLGLNLAFPQALDRTLMPALQSPWFVPHVVTYLTSYAVLGLSATVAAWRLWRRVGDVDLPFTLIHAGVPLLTIGMCLGAVWAKEAWGHYWAWDPKETWALLTWIAYVALLHAEGGLRRRPRACLAMVAACFAVVLMSWFLVNHLPSTAVSVHTYTRQ